MKINVVAKNIQVTPALKEMVEKKISKLDKYFDPNVEAKATLSVQKSSQIIEVTIPFNGVVLRVEESTDDMYKSIDLAEEKLQRQIRKQKTKLAKRNSCGSLRYPDFYPVDSDDEIVDDAKVVKTKSFDVKPMSQEEAILQMNLLGHDFFVFTNEATNQINILYRRKYCTVRFTKDMRWQVHFKPILLLFAILFKISISCNIFFI